MQVMFEQFGGMFVSWFMFVVEGVILEFVLEIEGMIMFSNG